MNGGGHVFESSVRCVLVVVDVGGVIFAGSTFTSTTHTKERERFSPMRPNQSFAAHYYTFLNMKIITVIYSHRHTYRLDTLCNQLLKL